jgi:hypothetical protein
MAEPPASIRALAADRRAGAGEIARRAARALGELDPRLTRPSLEALLRGHPGMAPLWRLAGAILAAPSPRLGAAAFLRELDEDGRAAAVAASVLPRTVVTISWSSSVLHALLVRRPDGVRCMASHPGGEGARMAAALREHLPDVRVVPDEEALADPAAEAALFGADAIGPGGAVNKVGTRALCRAARRAGIPTICVAGETKLLGEDLPAGGAFERVPLGSVDVVALPDGPAGPAEVTARLGRFPLHPSLRPLLEELRAIG